MAAEPRLRRFSPLCTLNQRRQHCPVKSPDRPEGEKPANRAEMNRNDANVPFHAQELSRAPVGHHHEPRFSVPDRDIWRVCTRTIELVTLGGCQLLDRIRVREH